MNSRLVTANISVSRFSSALSLVLRMSAGEKRLKTSSVDSGNSQNWYTQVRRQAGTMVEGDFTEAQY